MADESAPVPTGAGGVGAGGTRGGNVAGAGGTDDAPLGMDNVGIDGVDPRLGDDDGSLCCDLVVCGAGPGAPWCTTLGNTVPAPGSSIAMAPGVAILLLPGSPGLSPPPIKWGQVEDSV
jgi:hypothetical protein